MNEATKKKKKKEIDPRVAQALQQAVDPMINRDSGNIILIVASSETGKSTILANVLLEILRKSNGFITTFMSPSFDSLPLQSLILRNLSEKRKVKKSTDGNPTGFEMADLYKTKEWMFTKRGFDANYCRKIYNMKLQLNKHYGEADKVKEFRFVLALDDLIDIGGHLIREVCLTWRNKGITWIQLVQDITNLDCAVRNSAPIVFFGHLNFPMRRKQICDEYLSPYLPGVNIYEKMDLYARLTADKKFLLMNHRLRTCFHLDTQTGVVTELKELTTSQDHLNGTYQLQRSLYIEGGVKPGEKDDDKQRKRKRGEVEGALPGSVGGVDYSKALVSSRRRSRGSEDFHHNHEKQKKKRKKSYSGKK